jgi:hypothetical protein
VTRFRCGDLAIRSYRTHSLCRKVAGENGKPPHHQALGLGQQLIAPIERCTQCLVPRQSRSAAAGQHSQAVIQARGDLLKPKRGNASCRQIDGQRNAIEAPTYCSNCWKGFSIRQKIRLQRLRRGDEKLHCAVTKDIAGFLTR